jgi:hypothetical protein
MPEDGLQYLRAFHPTAVENRVIRQGFPISQYFHLIEEDAYHLYTL